MEKNKLKLLHILDILKETDELHPITANQIIIELTRYGIEAERKSVLRDISALVDYGYDILLHADNKLGYYMASRTFEDWELKVLCDAAIGAKFLTEDNSRMLFDKVCSLASSDGRKMLRSVTPVPSAVKIGSPLVKISIDITLKAIRRNKKIKFKYTAIGADLEAHYKRDGSFYCVNPYALIWRQDNYYLIGNFDRYDDLSLYRLDRIRDMEITEEVMKPLDTILGSNADLKLKEYIAKNVYNYIGEPVRLVLQTTEDLMDDLVDYFGENIRVTKKGDCIRAEVSVLKSSGLFFWLLQYGQYVTLLEPEEMRAEVVRRLRVIQSKYEPMGSDKQRSSDEE